MPTLDAKIPKEDQVVIRDILNMTSLFKNVTLTELSNDLQEKQTESGYFPVFKKFFSYLFNTFTQTELINGNLYLGVELRVGPFNSYPLLRALNMSYQEMVNVTSYPGQPNPPLTQTQIDQLLGFSLTSVSNNFGNFTGCLPLLQQVANPRIETLSFNRLVGLISATYLQNFQLPLGLLESIANMPDGPLNDWAMLEMINGAVNDQADVETQNRLLKIAGLIHGKVNATDLDIYLTKQEELRILLANPGTVIADGPVNKGISIGNYQANNFEGFVNITELSAPTFEDFPWQNNQKKIVLGTPKDDILYAINNCGDSLKNCTVDAALYGGFGKDTLKVSLNIRFVYMAGNANSDRYVFLPASGPFDTTNWFTIYDSDHQGEIETYDPNNKVFFSFSGPIVDGQLSLFENTYSANSFNESDGTTTLQLKATIGSFSLNILDYKPGQFNILPNTESQLVAKISGNVVSAVTADYISFVPMGEDGGTMYIYYFNDTLARKVPLLGQGDSWSQVNVVPDSKGNFVVGGLTADNCHLNYADVDPDSGSANVTLVDQFKGWECSNGWAFPKTWVAAVGSDQTTVGLSYLKLLADPYKYALNNFLPESGIEQLQVYQDNSYGEDTKLCAGPTDRGLLIASNCGTSSLQDGYQTYTFEIDRFGNSLANQTLPNVAITAVSSRSNGYTVYYAKGADPFGPNKKNYLASVSNGQWNSVEMPYCGDTYFNTGIRPLLVQLKDNSLLLLSYSSNCVLDSEFKVIMGPFYVFPTPAPEYRGWLGVSPLPNGDVMGTYQVENGDGQRSLQMPFSSLYNYHQLVPVRISVQQFEIKKSLTPSETSSSEEGSSQHSAASRLTFPEIPSLAQVIMLVPVFWEWGKWAFQAISSLIESACEPKKVELSSTQKRQLQRLQKLEALADGCSQDLKWKIEDLHTDIENAKTAEEKKQIDDGLNYLKRCLIRRGIYKRGVHKTQSNYRFFPSNISLQENKGTTDNFQIANNGHVHRSAPGL